MKIRDQSEHPVYNEEQKDHIKKKKNSGRDGGMGTTGT